ncbi:MAG: MBL fold metallo-hydrolase [Candidatus Marinimicrobia bacterium]|nr:MBL fold metallo-hydrolase [Candidatus Neomarinimicrobiota bacterium]
MCVDAALPFETVRPFINGAFVAMLITHTHGDHIAFIDEYLEAFPELLIIVHEDSAGRISALNVHPALDGEQIQVGQLLIDVLHTPGHFPDSCCYKLENVIFTGDTLFVGRTGRTVSQGSDTGKLYQSVYDKLLTLPQDTIIYPGHDYGRSPTITLAKNIEISPLLQAANKQDFIERMAAFEASRNQPL